jgi:hypothetical protein
MREVIHEPTLVLFGNRHFFLDIFILATDFSKLHIADISYKPTATKTATRQFWPLEIREAKIT